MSGATGSSTIEAHLALGIHISGLRFAYKRGFSLSIPSLHIAAGEQVLLAGSSGSGKSTLLHLIAGLENPDAGSIQIRGTDICALHGARRDTFRGKNIGMIFQTFNLLQGFTAIENVMMALMLAGYSTSDQRSRADSALRRLNISDVNAPVENLSVGQQQRVAVARAMAGEPCIVLADEPTASLDPANAVGAINIIKDAARATGAALIVTSHDPSLREAFSRIEEISDLCKAEVQR